MGITNPKTMKLLGKVKESEVVVMIDPGATHNFMSLAVVQKLGIPVTQIGGFGVSLGTGEAVQGYGELRGVLFQGIHVLGDFLPLTLGNSDVILGVQWLEKLGAVSTNWKTQIMKFLVNGMSITLRGDPSLARSKVTLKNMLWTIVNGGEGYLLQLNQVEFTPPDVTPPPNLPLFLQDIVQKYEQVFEWPGGLPPHRGKEHAIILKEGTGPMSVRPYRYSHAQINEI